ncbi:MAG TPA: carbamate kinase [Elusimicrobia bacterium]|nr:carbamate kinase [Elusimicrobiota bacterium]HBT61999.1 carbamate kinase [Elusimicrobiota bacterium]
MEHELFVVALGGNALLSPKEKGTTEEQSLNAERTCEQLAPLIKPEFHLVITHGNGPQVGNINLQQELAKPEVPPLSLDACVAMSEGSMGHFLQMGMLNSLRRRRYRRYVVTCITQVIVDPDDPAFKNPTKPVGRFYSEEEAKSLAKERGWTVVEDAKRGWRRVVPSPKPVKVIQRHMIKTQVLFGDIVICVGGGGVPVVQMPDKTYKAVEAVIDKDLASSVLASSIRADCMIILTAVPNVCLNFKTPQEKVLAHVTTRQLRKHLEEGHFAAGSMRPKVEAALNHLANEGRRVIITDIESLPKALQGKAGTHIQRYHED